MNFKVYRMNFRSAVHFGNGKLNTSGYTLTASRLFAAICQEALHENGAEGLERLVDLCHSDVLRLTDAFPFGPDASSGTQYYVPKPLLYVEHGENEGSSVLKKQAKKLKYIGVNQMEAYLSGSLDVKNANEAFSKIGRTDVREMSAVKDLDSAVPYPVGTFCFSKGWGLYCIIGYEDEEILFWIEDLLVSLGYSGIGGKKTDGLGQFELQFGNDFPAEIMGNLSVEQNLKGRYVLLASAMAESLNDGILENASYSIGKSSGFIASASYAETLRKKRDFFYFESGSVFSKTFRGQIADVSNRGTHPVYGYYMPVFLEVPA